MDLIFWRSLKPLKEWRKRVMFQKTILFLVIQIASSSVASQPLLVDFTKSAFEPMAGSRDVSFAELAGKDSVRLPCNFQAAKIDRASWDVKVKLDLTMCRGVQFDFYCANPLPVSHFSMYFRSGAGWYSIGFDAAASGKWTTVQIDKSAARIEGTPAGWADIDTVRISAWRGGDTDTEFFITGLSLFGGDTKIVVIRADSFAGDKADELKAVNQYIETIAQFLDTAHLPYIVVSDLDITPDRLKNVKLIILPHNPSIPDTIADHIAAFLGAGGKMISCYNLPGRLQDAAGIKNDAFIRQPRPGHFDSIRASETPLKGSPSVTKQASWNIHNVLPVAGRSRVAAWWYNDKNESTGKAAIVISDNTVHLTHVLLSDDRANKFQLLLAMVGNLCGDLWRDAATGCIEQIGAFGPYANFATAYNDIKTLAGDGADALSALDLATRRRKQAIEKLDSGEYSDAIITAEAAGKSIVDAYSLAQKPLPGEHRAFWCHSAFGVNGLSWDDAIKTLADNGFTAILPNMLWGGVAFYESDLLPVSPAVKEKGDQIALCLAACKKYGVGCHVWKVNYNMGWASPKEFIAQMKQQGRTQREFDGTEKERWLCPSHPANQKLEIESMVEVARKYDVDGVHFDYIRYPGPQGCFCDGCRERFQEAVGRKIADWPGDVRNDDELNEKWLAFRREQITTVVASVAGRLRKTRPGVKISAAVFRNWPTDRDSVGQDWKIWCEKGYLDFVCPMDYTPLNSLFERMVTQQTGWAGDVPCYPGIGLSVWPDKTDIVKLIEQINITRKHNTGGFTIFNYGPTEAKQVLPKLGKGITKKP